MFMEASLPYYPQAEEIIEFNLLVRFQMEKSSLLSARERLGIVSEELARFNRLVAGHRRLLEAIGSLRLQSLELVGNVLALFQFAGRGDNG